MSNFTNHFDTIHMGRSGLDLYANEVGVPFPDIQNFAAYVGGSPTNICVGAQRQGLKTLLMTAFGDDPVGDFLAQFLRNEGVELTYSPRKVGYRTSATVLGIEPPDRFPLVYYRERCADRQLEIEDVLSAPFDKCRIFQFAGTNLSHEPARSATMLAVELAREAGAEVVLDLDFRPDQWHDPRAFGVAVRAVLPQVDIVIGTEDELNAAVLTDASQLQITASQISDARVAGDNNAAIARLLNFGPRVLLQKLGPEGVRVHEKQENGRVVAETISGFPVEVTNVLGAGDAFAAGFLSGYLRGWSLSEAARWGNACGAIVVTQHGCANYMPTFDEVSQFIEQHQLQNV